MKFIVLLLLTRSFGNIIHDLATKYNGRISIKDFRLHEKWSFKLQKARLNLSFLTNCRALNVFPKFLCVPLPNTNHHDVHAIRKRLLRSAIKKRSREIKILETEHEKMTNHVKQILDGLDWFVLNKSLNRNIERKIFKAAKIHKKKLQNLTRSSTIPFSPNETIRNLSTH